MDADRYRMPWRLRVRVWLFETFGIGSYARLFIDVTDDGFRQGWRAGRPSSSVEG